MSIATRVCQVTVFACSKLYNEVCVEACNMDWASPVAKLVSKGKMDGNVSSANQPLRANRANQLRGRGGRGILQKCD